MSYLNATYLNQYIYSPVTHYHKVNNNAKLVAIHSMILIILYFNINKAILFSLVWFILMIWITLYNNSRPTLYRILKNNTLYLLNILTITYLLDNRNIKQDNILVNQIFIPCQLNIKQYNYIYQLKYYHIVYSTPKYIFKLLYTYIANYNLNYILFIFIQSEVILESFIKNFNNLLVSIGFKYNKYIMNLYLGCQSLEKIIKIWNNNSAGREIKADGLIYKQVINIGIVLVKSYNFILNSESSNSIILWNRSLSHKNFTEIQYYY